MIHVPPPAIELAKCFEGFHQVKKGALGRAHPYVCPADYWTIGYGGLCYRDHPAMTEAYFAGHLRTAPDGTLRHCSVLTVKTEPRLATIVDFTVNLGAGRLQASTLRRRINERDRAASVQELRRCVLGWGHLLPG